MAGGQHPFLISVTSSGASVTYYVSGVSSGPTLAATQLRLINDGTSHVFVDFSGPGISIVAGTSGNGFLLKTTETIQISSAFPGSQGGSMDGFSAVTTTGSTGILRGVALRI